MKKNIILSIAIAASLQATAQQLKSQPFSSQTEASSYTRAFNDSIAKVVATFGREDFENANRGFIARYDEKTNPKVNGRDLITLDSWDFLNKEAPATVNPALWRQSQLNSIHGLFEVVPGKIWQVRGYDLANVTFVRTDNGYIVIDAGTNEHGTAAGFELVKKHVGDFPVRAIIITHSHGDHYGGINGILKHVVNKGDSIPIIAPKDFFINSVQENVLAGIPMGRRASYMFGGSLKRDERGTVGAGLGNGLHINAAGSALLPATYEVTKDHETLTIDGLQLEFHLALNSEAPSEMLIYIPQYKALQQAEDINHTLHNLLTPRGAKIRNGLAWSKYIDNVLLEYGDKVDVSLGSHHWPVWGNDKVIELWEKQRDLYRFIHDHTLYLANQGFTPNEISNRIKLPLAISNYTADREYYGSASFNARSQYELYFGFYDGNPVNLDPLEPEVEGKNYVEAIGGAGAVLKIANKAYKNGNYRWAASLLNKLVFAEPTNKEARQLLAKTYSQLAYQAESAPYRNFYLTGAKELLEKSEKNSLQFGGRGGRSNLTITPTLFFDVIATRINGYKNDSQDINLNIEITDTDEKIALILKNGALTNRPDYQLKKAQGTIKTDKKSLYDLFSKLTTLDDLQNNGKISLTGDDTAIKTLLSLLEQANYGFNIIEP
ncbi:MULTISPECIES: alkyl/aryl-sulfatase [unclassified Bacteroides]|uniref:alkyl/aryl-sulfatase n=1 Tax=unclassified Bacteroides TaxID=2646097 RepID=UPI0004E1C4B3|nr:MULTISPECIES: alkyl sulfatase dimerization domain-containing protein [unclassified Bacteroides]